jgi:hypothetical protein
LYLNPSLPVLLLKLQPMIISLIASCVLHEKLSRYFFFLDSDGFGSKCRFKFS